MIKYLDIKALNAPYKLQLKEKFEDFLDSGSYILGEEVKRFETNYAKYCGTEYCVGVGNGLDALTLVLKSFIALKKLKKGDKVLVPANTFAATILSVMHADLKPVLIEPDINTYNISVDEVSNNITDEVRAIIAVHLYGQLADMEALRSIADDNKLLLIEDAAQAHGARDLNGARAGNLADAAAFSFYPTKNLGALGDAGAITTNDKELFAKVRSLRNYGSDKKYHFNDIGLNSRLDEIQAAFLNIKLGDLDAENKKRREIAVRFTESINNPKIRLPEYNGAENHVFYVFPVRVKDRKDFVSYLSLSGIETNVHYPIAPHLQKSFANFSDVSLPISESMHNSVVSLPSNPTLSNKDVDKIIKEINQY